MTDGSNLTPLGRLIREVMESEGLTYGDLAKRSGAGDEALLRGQIKGFENPRKESLKRDNVLALARALRRPAWKVWEAMGETLEIPQRPDHRPELSVRTEDPLFGVLTPGDVNEVVAHAIKIAELRQAR